MSLYTLDSFMRATVKGCFGALITGYITSLSRAGVRFTDSEDPHYFIKTLHSVIPYRRRHLKLLLAPQFTLSDLEKWRIQQIASFVEEYVKTGKAI